LASQCPPELVCKPIEFTGGLVSAGSIVNKIIGKPTIRVEGNRPTPLFGRQQLQRQGEIRTTATKNRPAFSVVSPLRHAHAHSPFRPAANLLLTIRKPATAASFAFANRLNVGRR
jgi:hypothetical protein